LGLGERFDSARDLVRLVNLDDLTECYNAIATKALEIKEEAPTSHLLADYTGGTKTMAVALALVGLDHQFTLYITTGRRSDIIKVTRGELTSAVSTSNLALRRFLDHSLPELLRTYNYAAATSELKRLLLAGVEVKARHEVQRLSDLCAGFKAWDRFDHVEAWDLLEPYMRDPTIKSSGVFLRFVIGSRVRIDESFSGKGGKYGHGFELVEDLLLNGERRAAQSRYDDATGRLYRALELLAQIRLRAAHDLNTGSLDLEKLPHDLRPDYEARREAPNKRIVLGLIESYELLYGLQDALGQLYQEHAGALKDVLTVRNYSLFAHGFAPVTESRYRTFREVLVPFIQEGIEVCGAKKAQRALQFPTRF
jgi:CRISPR-associated protein (TIGR02710 family)